MNPSPSSLDPPGGIYIHVPFCQAKCPYCDFYSITDLARIPDYLGALCEELRRCRGRIARADTIYFGGGTPSLLTPSQIQGIIDAVNAAFNMADDVEITLEVNPGTVGREDLEGYTAAGVNRLNIGLQSIDDAALGFLGRIHTAQQGREAYRWAREAGFDNVGLDLIYGLPGQTLAQWEAQLSTVAALRADHLSCYTLTLEPGTPLTEKIAAGLASPPDDECVGLLFTHTAEWLNAHGYRQYEISNFAMDTGDRRIDRRSRHNRKYWTLAPYLGFGPQAHSYATGRRWWNHRSLDRYLADLAAGRRPVAERETLTRDQQMIEFVYLGLRQTEGIDTADFYRRFGSDFFDCYGARTDPLIHDGLIARHGQRLRLTRRGMCFLEGVVGRIIG